MTFTYIVLLALALLIISVLVFFAVSSWKAVQHQEERLQNEADKNNQRKEKVLKDIRFMVNVVVEGQVTLTEAAIRLSAFKLALSSEDQQALKLDSYVDLANATAHIPILHKWQLLSKEQQIEFDIQREKLESMYEEKMLIESKEYLLSH